jgi:hypothetical protein
MLKDNAACPGQNIHKPAGEVWASDYTAATDKRWFLESFNDAAYFFLLL